MKSKNKTGATDQNRPSKRDEKQGASAGQPTRNANSDRSHQDENKTHFARSYYSRNGGHGGYNGL